MFGEQGDFMNNFAFEGELKVSSSMDQNIYVLLNKDGTYIGDITISDNNILDRLDNLFISEALVRGDIRPNDKQVRGGMKIGVKIEFKARE